MNKYYKNFILCGEVDYHCLLCVESFQLLPDVDKHLRWHQHRMTLKYQDYFPKFKNECIYKIEDKFYCEVCNYLTKDIALLKVHVKQDEHKTNKKNPKITKKTLAKRDAQYIVVAGVTLNKRQWNGIIKNDCILCECPLGNFDKHVTSASHIINLIQTETVCEEGDRYYRKINDSTFYCVPCKKPYPMVDFNDHWDHQYHLDNAMRNVKAPEESKTSEAEKLSKMEELEKKLIEAQKVYYYINYETKRAKCKQCKIPVDFNFKAMVAHHKDHDQAPPPQRPHLQVPKHDISDDSEEEVRYKDLVDHGKLRHEMAEYGRKHFIKMNQGGSKGHCRLCNVYLSANIRIFKEHVKGTRHHCFLESKGLKKVTPYPKPEYYSLSFKEYMKNSFHIPERDMFWMNESLCISTESFNLIYSLKLSPYHNKILCYACDTIFVETEEKQHLNSETHMKAVLDSKVIPAFKGEFIRELRTNIYHCGICNNLYSRWDVLDKHLTAFNHLVDKKESYEVADIARYMFDNYKQTVKNNQKINPEVLYLELANLSIK